MEVANTQSPREKQAQGSIARAMDRVFAFLCSLKLAVVVILGLAIALAVGTVLESVYDTPTAQYYVYRASWFHAVLAALGINIFCVAVSRWPWKPRHIPFLLAHLGILMLLGGAWMTDRFGLDGNLRIAEGESANVVQVEEYSLVLIDSKQMHKVRVPWIPPGVEFKPISLKAQGLPYDLTIDRFLPHADASFSFVPKDALAQDRVAAGGGRELAAAKLRLQGGPMNITQDFWLWMGDPSFKAVQMGPASFAIGPDAPAPQPGRPALILQPEKGGGLTYRAHASDGKQVKGSFSSDKAAVGQVIQPGWKGNVRLTILEWSRDATPLVQYAPARIQYGQQAPGSAIRVVSGKGGEGAETWLGVGDRAMLHAPEGQVELGYMPKRIALPFSVRLDRFQIDRYEGSMDPASYSSRVTVFADREQKGEGKLSVISMNEPLTAQGITLYQASYEDAMPRPTVSIFSVNRDPGRPWKYYGSLLLVFGSILLFAVKYRKSKATAPRAAPEVVL